jgi:hypothetical protein
MTIATGAYRGRVRRLAAWTVAAGMFLGIGLVGLPYYVAPLSERVRHPLHAWLKPSGTVGQSAGILALSMFLFMWLYPLRKRVRWFRIGRLPRWLDVHVAVGLALPVVGAIHAAWRFDGLIGLGYLAMLLVCASGVVGRFLYRRIPRVSTGTELDAQQLQVRRAELVRGIASRLGLDPIALDRELHEALDIGGTRTVHGSVVAVVRSELASRRVARRLRDVARRRRGGQEARDAPLRPLVRGIRREVALLQQMALLDVTRRLFRLWHVAHLPVALTALGAVLVHVAVVIAMGVTWLW